MKPLHPGDGRTRWAASHRTGSPPKPGYVAIPAKVPSYVSLERSRPQRHSDLCLAGPLVLLAVERRQISGCQSYNAMPGGCPTARFAIGHRDLNRSVRMLKRQCGSRLTRNAITRERLRLRSMSAYNLRAFANCLRHGRNLEMFRM